MRLYYIITNFSLNYLLAGGREIACHFFYFSKKIFCLHNKCMLCAF